MKKIMSKLKKDLSTSCEFEVNLPNFFFIAYYQLDLA